MREGAGGAGPSRVRPRNVGVDGRGGRRRVGGEAGEARDRDERPEPVVSMSFLS